MISKRHSHELSRISSLSKYDNKQLKQKNVQSISKQKMDRTSHVLSISKRQNKERLENKKNVCQNY